MDFKTPLNHEMCSKHEGAVPFHITSCSGLNLISRSQANTKGSQPLPVPRLEGSVPERQVSKHKGDDLPLGGMHLQTISCGINFIIKRSVWDGFNLT